MEGSKKFKVLKGDSDRLGVNRLSFGYQFAITAEEGQDVSLLLYPRGKEEPCAQFPMDENIWCGQVRTLCLADLPAEKYEYNYQIDGEVVVDPYARKLVGRGAFGTPWPVEPHKVRGGLMAGGMEPEEGVALPYQEMILYKVHVRGYTMQKNSKVKKKGTFLGLIEKIPYWQELGVTAIELMPAYEFLELPKPLEKKELYGVSQIRNEKQINYWGYTNAYYYAPKSAYAYGNRPEEEFGALVSALHRAGLQCIMEFYFDSHTASVQILDILRFWKQQYHVDGFHLIGEGIPQDLLVQDPVLAGSKLLFLGLWDGLNDSGRTGSKRRLGEYSGSFARWARRLLKSDEGVLSEAAGCFRRNPFDHGVINYITMQDGFTLADLVSYENKHNEANGEDNRDGSDCNFSWNCGAEGPTRKPSIRALRLRQMKNAWLMLFLSQGTPLIYGGDEFGNSQNGNNNAYCQDNEVGWVDWRYQKKNAELTAFVKKAIAFRRAHPILHMEAEPKGSDYRSYGYPDISYHSQRAWYAGMEYNSRCLGIMYGCAYGEEEKDSFLYLAYNFYWEAKELALPKLPEGGFWEKVFDTYGGAASAISEDQKILTVPPRTILVLVGK